MRPSTDQKAAASGAEEGAPERPKPSEREAVNRAAQPEPEPEFCDEQLLAEPEPEPERLRVAWDCAGATKEGQLIFLSAGDVVQVAERPKDHWIIVRKTSGETGLVPETYFRALEGAAEPEPSPRHPIGRGEGGQGRKRAGARGARRGRERQPARAGQAAGPGPPP